MKNSPKQLRIATRKSALALWQAEHVKSELEKHHPELDVELVPMSSKGDKLLDTPLAKIGGKGLFLKELEQAILEDRADIAVHSMKDVPVEFPDGLALTHICEREDPRDAFVSNSYETLDALPLGSIVGTSSLRREAQLKHHRPDLEVRFLRGNVNTRLQKLDDGAYDAIILATAGLLRLEFPHRIQQVLPVEICLPAVGQGAVGIECRSGDSDIQALLDCLHHTETTHRLAAERAMNRELQGGCQVPIAGYATLERGQLRLEGRVASVDGKELLKAEHTGPVEEADAIGVHVARQLLSSGADRILAEVYGNQQEQT